MLNNCSCVYQAGVYNKVKVKSNIENSPQSGTVEIILLHRNLRSLRECSHILTKNNAQMITLVSHNVKILTSSMCSILEGSDLDSNILNPFPNEKYLDLTKFKAFADDKLNAAEIITSLSGRVENIVGKGENAGYQHFLLFPQCFQRLLFQGR